MLSYAETDQTINPRPIAADSEKQNFRVSTFRVGLADFLVNY